MTATAALAKAFLDGRVLSIKTAFKDFGVTNLPRECGRSIERKFGVQLARVKKEGKTRYGVPCTWYEYRLPATEYNTEGRLKMVEYIAAHTTKPVVEQKTESQTNKLF
jgi:hypothetical protein